MTPANYGYEPTPAPSPVPPPPARAGKPDYSWVRAALGGLAVLLGVELMLELLVSRELALLPPAVGLVVLSAWFRTGKPVFLPLGTVLTGAGTGMLLASLIGGLGHVLVPLGAAAGCYAMHRLSPRSGIVPWILLAAFASTALTRAVGEVAGWLPGFLRSIAGPGALIVLGVLFLQWRRVSGRSRAALIVTLLVLSSAALSDPEAQVSTILGRSQPAEKTEAIELPAIEGKTLVITGGDGDVVVRTGELAVTARIRAQASSNEAARRLLDRARAEASTGEREIRVASVEEINGVRIGYAVSVPPGVPLKVMTTSGDVVAHLERAGESGQRLEVETWSGDVTIVLMAAAEAAVATRSGDVAVVSHGQPAVDVETWSGRIEVDGQRERVERFRDPGSAREGSVRVATRSGDVEVQRVRRPASRR